MTDDSDDYGISGDQCGNDHEETDSQEFQDEYKKARLAEEKRSEKFVPTNNPYAKCPLTLHP